MRAIETASTDAFSFVNGSLGYYIDAVELQQGDRVIFQNDNDATVKSNIYTVTFVSVDSSNVLYLDLQLEEEPAEGNTVVVTNGTNNKGKKEFSEKEKEWCITTWSGAAPAALVVEAYHRKLYLDICLRSQRWQECLASR